MKLQTAFNAGLDWLGTFIALLAVLSFMWLGGWVLLQLALFHTGLFLLIITVAVMAGLITAIRIRGDKGGITDNAD